MCTLLTGCPAAPRVEVGPLQPAHLEPLPGVPMTVRVVAQDVGGQVVPFVQATATKRGRKRTQPAADTGSIDPRSDQLLRPRADTFRSGTARVMVWLDLGPTKNVEVHPDKVTLLVDGQSITPKPRWWRACSAVNECYGMSDPDGSNSPSTLPFPVNGVAWVQLYYGVAALPRRELLVRIDGVAQQGKKPMTTELRFVRRE